MVGGGTGTVAGAFKANVSKDWRDVFGGMFNGIIYGAGAGLVSSLVMEVGYQLQLRNGRTPVNSADMIDVIKSNTGEIVRNSAPSYMNYNYWDSSTPTAIFTNTKFTITINRDKANCISILIQIIYICKKCL